MMNFNEDSKLQTILNFLHKHIIGVIIIVAVIGCLISMLQIVKNSNIKNKTEETQYEAADTIYLPMTMVNTLNPISSTSNDVNSIASLVYNGLFSLDKNLNIEPELVDTYKTNSKYGTVTVKLKSGVTFQNGVALTAYDVKFTVDAIKYYGSKGFYYDYASKISYIQVNSNLNLTIHFINSSNAALDNLIFPIVSSKQYNSIYEFVNATNYKPIGTGQYKYSSYNQLKYLRLKPYNNYFGDVAKNKIEFEVLPNKKTVSSLMTIDGVTAYLSKSSTIDSMADDKNLLITKIQGNKMDYLGFNFKNPNLAIKKVRQAIALSIDLKQLESDIYLNNGIVSDSIYFPNFLGSKNIGDPYQINPENALNLLKSQGYKDNDGTIEDSLGAKIYISILVNRENLTRVDVAKSIAKSINDLGFVAKVDSVSWSTYKAKLANGDFDIYLGGYTFEKRYNLSVLLTENNYINYNNSEVTENVKKLETAMSAESYLSTYNKLKSRLIEDLPYYCLNYESFSLLTVKTFKATDLPTFFNCYNGISTWQWEKVLKQSNTN